MGAAGIHTVSGFILRVWDGAELGPSAEKIWKETVDKDSEAAAAKKSATGGDRAWRKGLHSVRTFLNLIISD